MNEQVDMTVILPGEPQDVALEIGKKVALWFHERHGKEITYELISKKQFANKIHMPKNVQRAMHVDDGECFLALKVIPEEDWNSQQARAFMQAVGQVAWQIFAEMCGGYPGGDDDEGEEWKNN